MSTKSNLAIINWQFSFQFYLEDPQPRSELSVTRVRGSVHWAISAGEHRSLSRGLQFTITAVRAEIKRTCLHIVSQSQWNTYPRLPEGSIFLLDPPAWFLGDKDVFSFLHYFFQEDHVLFSLFTQVTQFKKVSIDWIKSTQYYCISSLSSSDQAVLLFLILNVL